MSGGVSATTVMAAASLAITAAGTGAAMVAQSQQAEAQQKSADYQAAVARNNATAAGYNAQSAIDQGEIAAQTQQIKTRNLVGAQRAAQAANGVDINSGTPLDIQSDAAMLGQLDALTIRYNAQTKANNYLAQAGQYNSQAGLFDMQGDNAASAGMIGMGTSLLGGAASISDKWATYKQKGVL